jgi:hypothetical protein
MLFLFLIPLSLSKLSSQSGPDSEPSCESGVCTWLANTRNRLLIWGFLMALFMMIIWILILVRYYLFVEEKVVQELDIHAKPLDEEESI